MQILGENFLNRGNQLFALLFLFEALRFSIYYSCMIFLVDDLWFLKHLCSLISVSIKTALSCKVFSENGKCYFSLMLRRIEADQKLKMFSYISYLEELWVNCGWWLGHLALSFVVDTIYIQQKLMHADLNWDNICQPWIALLPVFIRGVKWQHCISKFLLGVWKDLK